MPALKNARHEFFAQGLAKGLSQSQAYAEAGYSPSEQHASRLARNGKVIARVAEIQNRRVVAVEWTAAERLQTLKDIALASAIEDRRTAIAAIAEANKMQGSHAAAKVQHSGNVGTYDLTKLKDDELERLESILGPVALAATDQGGEGTSSG